MGCRRVRLDWAMFHSNGLLEDEERDEKLYSLIADSELTWIVGPGCDDAGLTAKRTEKLECTNAYEI